MDTLASNMLNAFGTQFENMTVCAPKGSQWDEACVIDSLVEGTGKPDVKLSERNTVVLTFPGKTPLIKLMEIPLDAEHAGVIGQDENGNDIQALTVIEEKHNIVARKVIKFPPSGQSQKGLL